MKESRNVFLVLLPRLSLTLKWGVLSIGVVAGLGGCVPRTPTIEGDSRSAGARNQEPAVTAMSPQERKEFFAEKVAVTKCGVDPGASLDAVIDGLSECLERHEKGLTEAVLQKYPDEPFVIAAVVEAFKAVRSQPREFGIGAVLVEDQTIIGRAHNSQNGTLRTDLHAEMTLMTAYEEKTKGQRKGLPYAPNLRLYASTEPCPMCFTRVVIAGVTTFYGAPSAQDGMAHRLESLPVSWAAAARKVPVAKAKSSPQVDAIAEALFYSYTRFDEPRTTP